MASTAKQSDKVTSPDVYRILNEETLKYPYNYYLTPLAPPPAFPELPASQRRYFYLDVKPPPGVPERAAILLLHGFPDSSYGWRKVIAPLSMSGYRLIVPDLPGYGRTSKPKRLEEYSARTMANDLSGLMAYALGNPKTRFAVVGHDWGSFLAWKLPLWIPERLLGVHGICVAYVPPTDKYIPSQGLAARYPQYGYQVFFERPESTQIIESKLDTFLRFIFVATAKLLEKVDPHEAFKVFGAGADQVETGLDAKLANSEGFTRAFLLSPREKLVYDNLFDPRMGGSMDGLKWYRVRKITFDEERALSSKNLPALPYKQICPDMDPTGPADMAEKVRRYFPVRAKYSVQEVASCGHWVMLEQPQTVVDSIDQWMQKDVLPFHTSIFKSLLPKL